MRDNNKIILIALVLFMVPMYYPISFGGVEYLNTIPGIHFDGFSDGHSKFIPNVETPEQNHENLINYIKIING